MAKAGAKKRLEDNKSKLNNLLLIILIATITHCVVRLGFKRSSASAWNYVAAVGSVLMHTAAYKVLRNLADPTYGTSGELLDGGADLKLGGTAEYCTDVILVTAVVQLAASLSDWLWLLYLVVPSFAFFKLWKHVLGPWFFAPPPEEYEETALERKKREKQERKMARAEKQGRVMYRR